MIIFKTLPEYYEFFNAIPEDKWCVNRFRNQLGQCCAIGHLTGEFGDSFTKNHPIRTKLRIKDDGEIYQYYDAARINNGSAEMAALGDTPKERILNAIVLVESGILKGEL